MTFETDFIYKDVPFKAVVTSNGKDLMANFVSPVQYEAMQTIVFTMHDDETMNYDKEMFNDAAFLPAMAAAILKSMHEQRLHVE